MIRVTPTSQNIVIRTEPAPTSATLSAKDRPTVTLAITPATPMDDLTTLGPVPADTPDGVYTLNLDTACGCRQAMIAVAMCPPAAFPSAVPDHDAPPVTECCDPPAPAPAPPGP